MTIVFVTTPGLRLSKSYERLVLTGEGTKYGEFPIHELEAVFLVGIADLTGPAVELLMQHDVEMVLMNRWGELIGTVMPGWKKKAALLIHQVDGNEDEEFLRAEVVRVLRAKWKGQGQWLKKKKFRLAEDMGSLVEGLESMSLAELRAAEKELGKRYYEIFAEVLGESRFSGRARAPWPDPINAMLEMGNGFLIWLAMSALERQGLEPGFGYMNGIRRGRLSLALDVVEPMRIWIDEFVLMLWKTKVLSAVEFVVGKDGWRLSREGSGLFLTKLAEEAKAKGWKEEIRREAEGVHRRLLGVGTRQRFGVVGEDEIDEETWEGIGETDG